MNWIEVRASTWRSECGRYEVDSTILCNEQGPRRYYEARRTRAHAEGPHLVCTCIKTAAEAKQLAEADAAE